MNEWNEGESKPVWLKFIALHLKLGTIGSAHGCQLSGYVMEYFSTQSFRDYFRVPRLGFFPLLPI